MGLQQRYRRLMGYNFLLTASMLLLRYFVFGIYMLCVCVYMWMPDCQPTSENLGTMERIQNASIESTIHLAHLNNAGPAGAKVCTSLFALCSSFLITHACVGCPLTITAMHTDKRRCGCKLRECAREGTGKKAGQTRQRSREAREGAGKRAS